ncbi:MAG: hypothetical protein OEV40_08455 [Acidimicrobiia bacterium]|nr:hypothetical protein [Acidimicrobiia bacterium]
MGDDRFEARDQLAALVTVEAFAGKMASARRLNLARGQIYEGGLAAETGSQNVDGSYWVIVGRRRCGRGRRRCRCWCGNGVVVVGAGLGQDQHGDGDYQEFQGRALERSEGCGETVRSLTRFVWDCMVFSVSSC